MIVCTYRAETPRCRVPDENTPHSPSGLLSRDGYLTDLGWRLIHVAGIGGADRGCSFFLACRTSRSATNSTAGRPGRSCTLMMIIVFTSVLYACPCLFVAISPTAVLFYGRPPPLELFLPCPFANAGNIRRRFERLISQEVLFPRGGRVSSLYSFAPSSLRHLLASSSVLFSMSM